MWALSLKNLYALTRTAIKGEQKELTRGSVNRAIYVLALPAMLELMMESLFVVVDLLFVSHLGEQAITIVGITASVSILIQSVATGLGIAATAMISRRIGERKQKMAGLTAMQAVYLGLLVGIPASIFTVLFHRQIIRFAGASEGLVHFGADFSRLMFAGAILMIMRILVNGIFRGCGDATRAMRALMIANTLNAILCWIFIFGPGPFYAYGITGAAYSMIVANSIVVLYQFYHLFSSSKIYVGKKQLLFAPVLMKRLLSLAFAGTVQFLVPSSSRFVMLMIVSKLGENVLAGYILANRIIMFTVLPAWGIANAAGVLTGQNLGAKQPDRAQESVWKTGYFNLFFLGLLSIILQLIPERITAFFTNDAAVTQNACLYLRYMSVAYFFFGFTMVISRALNAAGAVNTVTLLNIFMFYVVQIPLAYLLAITADWGSKGIFAGIMISEMVLATACIWVFKQERWKQIAL